MVSPRNPAHDHDRWPALLLALRRTARPDRARVAAYLSLARSPAGWGEYTEFLAVHRAWLSSLDHALAAAGTASRGPLPDEAQPPFDRELPPIESEPLAPPRSRAHALGYLYVLEAFRLGCSVLERRIRGMPDAGPAPATSSSTRHPWTELTQALDQVAPEDHPAVLQGAQEAFSAWERRLAGSLAHLGLGPLSTDAHAA